jgi:hypothetical protein
MAACYAPVPTDERQQACGAGLARGREGSR